MLSHIVRVIAHPGYLLQLDLDNGSTAVISLERKVATTRFGILQEREVWEKATTDGSSVHWNGYVSMTLREALEILVGA